MTKAFLLFCCFFFVNELQAGKIYTVPERILKSLGSEVHVSEGNLLYESQAAGYYSGGGGVVVRSPVKNLKFANIALPKIQSGCGGIDIYTGGFSFIKKKDLEKALQSISSNAAGFAFMLGVETVSPTTSNIMKQMQSWANTINGIGINSCETAAQLTGSLWPASEMASQHICRAIGTTGTAPLFSDHIEARHGCTQRKGSSKEKELVNTYMPFDGEYNIAWKALKKMPVFNEKNKELVEMYMTLVGTFVVKESENGESTPKVYPAKAENIEFLQRLVEGGTILKYICQDSDNCLTILEREDNLESGWCARIRHSLQSMQQKAIKDIPLDDEEKGLLATTRLPLYKFINVLSAYRRGKPCPLDLQNLADIIAWDILVQVMTEAIDTITQGCMHLKATSMYTNKIDDYVKSLERVRKTVYAYEEKTNKMIDLEMRLIEKIRLLENQINSEIMVN